jgi:hypothetical protein
MSGLKKLLVCAFVVLNLITVVSMNWPTWMVPSGQPLPAAPHARPSSLLQVAANLDALYAHLTGLDHDWRMFGVLPRANWRFVIKAQYADSAVVVLPLPLQSERTFWEWALFDFKEEKLHSQLLRHRWAREAYAGYLCRQYPSHNGSPVKAIIWELHTQRVLGPSEVGSRGTHLDPNVKRQILDVFPCR